MRYICRRPAGSSDWQAGTPRGVMARRGSRQERGMVRDYEGVNLQSGHGDGGAADKD
jgi:hypothetical protein